MFRFHLKTNEWEELHPTGTLLPESSDHTAIIYEGNMIIFGISKFKF